MSTVVDSIEDLITLVPGYDPYALAGDCTFDPDAAQTAVDFFHECLRHIEGAMADKPFALEPWQQAIVANLFGWLRPDGTRRYREAFIFVPRKNGKTPLAAGIALNILFRDDEAGQQNYIAAADKEGAALLFRHCKGMIEKEPELGDRCRIYGGNAQGGQSRSVVLNSDDSFLKVLSADADTKHGGNSHLIIIDELHAQPDRDLVDVLSTSLASANRPQPLMVYITTSDFERESICNEKHRYASQVRDGHIPDAAFLPVIYEATKEDDWTLPATWRKANPNLGVSVSEEYLQREAEKAKVTPSYENTFKRLHLNIRTEQDVRWLNMAAWDECGEIGGSEDWRGHRVALAIDFGWRDDYAALTAVWKDGDLWYVRPWFWIPEDGRRDKRLEPTRSFIAEKLVTVTPGNSTDIDAIYKQAEEIQAAASVCGVAIDPNNARKQGQDLMSRGFDVVEFTQSKAKYNEPCRLLESLLSERRLRHGGNKVLRWMASNAASEEDGQGNIMPKKKKSTEKIDGIAALCMSLGVMLGVDDTLSGQLFYST